MKNFYRKFQIVSKLPLWTSYLHRVYRDAIQDATKLKAQDALSDKPNFTCLLCGVSGEITAREYLNFVLEIKPKCKIIVIDLGQDQVNSVRQMVKREFPKANIEVKQANALNLNFIGDKSIDWIDTDGFFSFFTEQTLLELFKEWKRILKKDGFITFRELTSDGIVSSLANKLRDRASQVYMGIKLNLHTTNELYRDFEKVKFKFNRNSSPIPLLDRYCLVNT